MALAIVSRRADEVFTVDGCELEGPRRCDWSGVGALFGALLAGGCTFDAGFATFGVVARTLSPGFLAFIKLAWGEMSLYVVFPVVVFAGVAGFLAKAGREGLLFSVRDAAARRSYMDFILMACPAALREGPASL